MTRYGSLAVNQICSSIRAFNTNMDFMAQTSTSVKVDSEGSQRDLGLRSKHDYRMMYSAQRSEERWAATAQMLGIEGGLRYNKPKEALNPGQKRPTARIKKLPKVGSYVKQSSYNKEVVDKMVKKLNREDLLQIKPTDDPYAIYKDSCILMKIVKFEYRKPFIVISAMRAYDEHKRLTETRTLDETPIIYFTFNVTPILAKNGKPIDNPDLNRLRNWMWDKVDVTEKMTFATALESLVGKITSYSQIEVLPDLDENGVQKTYIDKKGKLQKAWKNNPEFLGYPSYDLENINNEVFNRKDKDYVGTYSNIHISHRQIANDNGDVRIEKKSDTVEVYYGDVLQRVYDIHRA